MPAQHRSTSSPTARLRNMSPGARRSLGLGLILLGMVTVLAVFFLALAFDGPPVQIVGLVLSAAAGLKVFVGWSMASR